MAIGFCTSPAAKHNGTSFRSGALKHGSRGVHRRFDLVDRWTPLFAPWQGIDMSKEASLALYRFDGCPWCERVRAAIDDLGIDVEERDIRRDEASARALHEATGRGRVPVLRIDEGTQTRWLPESADIVRYLYDTYGEGRRPALLASRIPQTAGLLLSLGLLVASFITESPTRHYLLAAGVMVFALRNSLPLLRLVLPRRRAG